MLLDVSRLPRRGLWAPDETSTAVDLATVVREMRTTIDQWADDGLIKPHASFGFAAAHNDSLAAGREDWDDPYRFTWFVVGWGTDGDRYVANAVHKLRALLRTGFDTLLLRQGEPGLFDTKVESMEADGTFLWGDFSWGGATVVQIGNLVIL